MPVRTVHRQPIADATFTTRTVIPVTNETRASTLIAILNVASFTGGVSPSLQLKLFFMNLQGIRTTAGKVNAAPGTIMAAGTQVMVYGPNAADTFGDDVNQGALPRNFEVEVDPNGDQTSADIELDIILC